MTSGMWAADTTALARRVGELRAVAAAVENVVSTLSISSCDLGPGDIGAAVTETVEKWREGLGEMQDKIDTIAGNVDDAVEVYTTVEQLSQDSFQGLYGVNP